MERESCSIAACICVTLTIVVFLISLKFHVLEITMMLLTALSSLICNFIIHFFIFFNFIFIFIMYCFLNYFFDVDVDVDVGAVTWIMLEHWLTSLKFVGIVGRFI